MSKENVAKIRDLQKAYNALKTSQKARITGELYDKYIALGKLANKYEINSTESLKLSVSTKLLQEIQQDSCKLEGKKTAMLPNRRIPGIQIN